MSEFIAKEKKKKKHSRYRKCYVTIAILFLMSISFVIGWRFMAYRWWPVLSPHIKKIVYQVLPSLEPVSDTYVDANPYIPRSDAEVGDIISKKDSLFYYFYFPTCPYCATYANMILDGLPKEITLPDGTRSSVVMISLNKHDEAECSIIFEYYEKHNIVKNDNQNDQVVPSIVIGNTYLRGSAQIREQFLRLLLTGEGLSTPLIDDAERAE